MTSPQPGIATGVDLSTLAGQHAHYSSVRARLVGRRPVVQRPEPVRLMIQSKPIDLPPEVMGEVPLNMLAPCSWKFIAAYASLKHGIDHETVMGPSRQKAHVAARNEAIYLVTLHTTFSVMRIAGLFGRDHTTALYILRKFPRIERSRANKLSLVAAIPASDCIPRINTPTARQVVAAGYAKGMSVLDIADQSGLSVSAVKAIAMRADIPHPSRPHHIRKSKLHWEAAGI